MSNGVLRNYPNLKWFASVRAQAYSGADKLKTAPDLGNFYLKEVKIIDGEDKVILVGTNDTLILVTGPKEELEIVLPKFEQSIAKAWGKIESVS